MAGCEVDRVELAAGGGIGVVDPGGVGHDGESGQWRKVDTQRAHGREDAVVRRVLDDEDVLLGVDLEEAGGGGAGPDVGLSGRGGPGGLGGVAVRGGGGGGGGG